MKANKLTKKQFKIVAIGLLLSICGAFATDILLPAFPTIQTFFHSTKHLVALSIPLYILPMALSLLIYGPLSDQIGRRPVTYCGYGIAIIGILVVIVAPSIQLFLTGRILMGLGMGASLGITRATIADVLQGKQLAIYVSYISLIFGLALLISPLLGAYLLYFGWHAIFMSLLSLNLSALIIYSVYGTETNTNLQTQAAHPKVLLKNYVTIFHSSIFVGYSMAAGIAMSANICYITLSAFILQNDYHLSPQVYGWITVAITSAAFVGKLINTRLIRTFTPKGVLIISYSLITSVGLVLAAAIGMHILSLELLLFCVFICTAVQNFIYSNAFVGAIKPFAQIKGFAAALYGAWQYLVPAILGSCIAIFINHSISALASAYTILGIIGFSSYYIFLYTNKTNALPLNH